MPYPTSINVHAHADDVLIISDYRPANGICVAIKENVDLWLERPEADRLSRMLATAFPDETAADYRRWRDPEYLASRLNPYGVETPKTVMPGDDLEMPF